MSRAFLVALCVACTVAASAFAHPGHEYKPVVSAEGDMLAYVTPQTLVVKAGRSVPMLINLYENRTFAPAEATSLEVTARSGEQVVRFEVSDAGTGFLANGTFPGRGAWLLELEMGEPEVRLRVPIEVYPDSPYHLESEDAWYGLHYAERESRLSFRFVEDETGRTVTPRDAMARIDRFDENGTLAGRAEVPLVESDEGGLVLRHEFDTWGRYEIRVRSATLGLGYEDLPPFELSIASAQDGSPDRSTGVPAPTAALAALVFVSAALVASRRR